MADKDAEKFITAVMDAVDESETDEELRERVCKAMGVYVQTESFQTIGEPIA